MKDTFDERAELFEQQQPTHSIEDLTPSNESEDDFDAFGKEPINHPAPPPARRNAKKQKVLTEFDLFFSSAIPHYDKDVSDPIRWWWERRSIYPILSQLAIEYLSILAMSSECERVFSQLRRLISFERTSLSDEIIEADECQKQWIRSEALAMVRNKEQESSRTSPPRSVEYI